MASDFTAYGSKPQRPTSLLGMYTAKTPRVPMFVLRPDQPLETTYAEATPYTGEPYGANAIIDSYMYHMNMVAGMYMTIKLKGE